MSGPATRTLRSALPGVLLVALVMLALFPGALFSQHSFYLDDLFAYHRPMRSLLVRLVHEDRGLPLWNPYSASGQPFAANPVHGLFHPLTAPFYLLPFETAFPLQVMLPPLLGLGAMYFLLATLGTSRGAALLGALAWGVGGYSLSVSHLHPIPAALVALPLMLAFQLRLCRAPTARAVAALAASTALVLLAGEPSTALIGCVLLGLVAAATLFDMPRSQVKTVVAASALGLLIGLATAGVCVLPALDFSRGTIRAGGLSAALAGSDWSLPPVRLIELFFPHALGHTDGPDDRWWWGRTLYPGHQFPYLYSLYAGLVPAVLALLTALRRPGPFAPWLAASVLGVLLAMGERLPLWSWLGQVPLFGMLRYPEKWMLLPCFAVAVGAALGFDAVRTEPAAARLARRLLAALVLVAGPLALAAAVLARSPGAAAGLGLGLAASDRVPPGIAGIVGEDLLRVALIGILALAAAARLGSARPALAGAVLIGLSAVDLVGAGRPLVRTLPIDLLRRPPTVLAPLAESAGAGADDGYLFHAAAWDPARSRLRQVFAPPVPLQWGIASTLENDFELTQMRWTRRATELHWQAVLADPSLTGALLARRSVTSVLTLDPHAVDLPAPLGEAAKAPLRRVAVRGPRPRLAFVERIEVAAQPEQWLEVVRRLGPASAAAVVLEPPDAARLPRQPSPGVVSEVERRPSHLRATLEVTGPAAGVLALNQTWHPGWRARLDGAPVPLLRADIALSALAVPPGRHRLELSYHEPSLARGAILSCAGLLAMAALVLAGRR